MRTLTAIFFGLLLVSLVSCDNTSRIGDTSIPVETTDATQDELQQRLDHALDYTLNQRRLSVEEHAAWQILHGVLAYGQEFPVEVDGEKRSAVQHLIDGGAMAGFGAEPGEVLENDRRGLKMPLEAGTKQGQGHADQWLAVLSQADLAADQTLQASGHEYTIDDWVRQVELDIPRNFQAEFSWTLIGLTAYRPTDHEWTDFEGTKWTMSDLVNIEADYELGDGPCGGTHRLIGLTMALQRHVASGGEVIGPWKKAEVIIGEAIIEAKKHQNADGSFSSNYISRGGVTPDLAQRLGATGHVVEFLSLALTDEQLKEPWMQRAVLNLCDLFDKTEEAPLECGALYHAAHGLVLYRDRVFPGDAN